MGTSIKTLTNLFIFLYIIVYINAVPYTKYGRSCHDIGCPRSQVCTMTQAQCKIGQHNGTECGVYPTCKKRDTGSYIANEDLQLSPVPENTELERSPIT